MEKGRLRVRSPPRLTRFFLFRTTLCHQACFVRRDCFGEMGAFDVNLRIYADYDFLLRLALRCRATVRYIPIIATDFVGGGVSSDPSMFKLMRQEVAVLRRRYFPAWERGAFSVFYGLTAPSIRDSMVRSRRLRPVARWYRYCVNMLYGIGGHGGAIGPKRPGLE